MKKTFRKIAATVISVVMLSSSFVIPVIAEKTAPTDADKTWRVINNGENNINKVDNKTIGLQRFTSNTNDVEVGIGEETSADKSLKLEQSSTDAGNVGNFKLMSYYAYPSVTSAEYLADKNKKYAVIGCDFYLDDDNVNRFRIDREHGRVSTAYYSLDDVSRQSWHNIYAIVDFSNISNNKFIYTYYLDGKEVASGVYGNQYNTEFPTQLRLVFDNSRVTQFDKEYTLKMHMDNIEYFVTDLDPTVAIVDYENNFNSRVIGEIYHDGFASHSYESSVGGKEEKDQSLKLTSGATNANNILHLQTKYPQAAYAKFEFSFLPGDDFTSMNFQTGWTQNITGTEITKAMLKDGWNKITYVMHDFDGKRTATTAASYQKKTAFYTYVNGRLVSLTYDRQQLLSVNAEKPYDCRAKFNFATSGAECYIDDFSFTQSALPPVIEYEGELEPTPVPTATPVPTVPPVPENKILIDNNFNSKNDSGITTKARYNATYENAVAGKSDDDYSYKMSSNKSAGSSTYYPEFRADINAPYTKVAFNIMPTCDNFKSIQLASSQNNSLSKGLYVGDNYLVKDRWNKVEFIITSEQTSNPGQNVAYPVLIDTYVNGKCIGCKEKTTIKASDNGTTYPVRVVVTDVDSEPSAMYIDDLYSVVSNVYPEIDEYPALSADESYATIEGKNIILKKATSISSLSAEGCEIGLYNSDFTKASGTTLKNGDIVVVRKDAVVVSYDVIVPDFSIDNISFAKLVDGKYVNTLKSNVEQGEYKYTVKVTNPTEEAVNVTPIIGVYDADGRLLKASVVSATSTTGDYRTEYSTDITITEKEEGANIKTFIWDDMENMIPYKTEHIKVLALGNSITRHEKSESLGWFGEWGMAATSPDKDYAHILQRYMADKDVEIEFKWKNIAYLENRIKELDSTDLAQFADEINFNPDVMIVFLGGNMPQDGTVTSADYEKMVNIFRKNDEDIKMIVGVTPNTSTSSMNLVYEAANKNGWDIANTKQFNGPTYNVRAEEKAEGIRLGVFSENVATAVMNHPGNYGMQCIADELWQHIEKAIDCVR